VCLLPALAVQYGAQGAGGGADLSPFRGAGLVGLPRSLRHRRSGRNEYQRTRAFLFLLPTALGSGHGGPRSTRTPTCSTRAPVKGDRTGKGTWSIFGPIFFFPPLLLLFTSARSDESCGSCAAFLNISWTAGARSHVWGRVGGAGRFSFFFFFFRFPFTRRRGAPRAATRTPTHGGYLGGTSPNPEDGEPPETRSSSSTSRRRSFLFVQHRELCALST